MSSTLHKIKDKLTGDKDHTETTTGSTTESSTGSSGYNTRSSSSHTAHEEAPIVKEHHHDDYEHVDKTKRDEIHEQDKVNTVIQPVRDEQDRSLQRHDVNEGTHVHEHGQRGLDDNAEAELRRRRDEIARQGGTEHTESYSQRDERPDTHVHERTNTVEQVQPVIEKDIYKPHEIQHHRKEVDIHHEPTKVVGTEVAPTVTVDEFNRNH